MNKNTRIVGTDSFQDAVIKVAEGNPGAFRVTLDLLTRAGKIDPDDFFGGLGSLMMLDTLNIYGSKIWMLYKDVCREDLTKMVAMLRGVQLGFLEEEDLLSAINNYGRGVDVEQILAQVQKELPNFGAQGV